MARNLPQLTVKAKGKLNRGGLQRLVTAIDLQRDLYNACILWLRARSETGRNTIRDLLRKDLNELRGENQDYGGIHRKVSDGIIERAISSHLRHTVPQEGTEPAGTPRLKTPERFRTLTILSRDKNATVRFRRNGRPKLKITGLPAIRLASTQDIPAGQQPSAMHITLKQGSIHVRLVYDQTRHPPLNPKPQVKTAPGIDLGEVLTIAVSNGLTYVSPNEEKVYAQLKEAQQKLQRTITAAMRVGYCGFKAVLDYGNKQALTAKGWPRRELVWLKAPTKSYLKARDTLSNLYDQLNQLRKDFRHRVTSEIVSTALEQGVDLIAVQRLQIPNMTASAKGTIDNPGRNVAAKSGLNRRILQQGWGEIIEMLDYKARKAGLRFVQVWPGRSSQTCCQCGAVDAKSRRFQQDFCCTTCGHNDNADLNASRVMAQRGLKIIRGPKASAA